MPSQTKRKIVKDDDEKPTGKVSDDLTVIEEEEEEEEKLPSNSQSNTNASDKASESAVVNDSDESDDGDLKIIEYVTPEELQASLPSSSKGGKKRTRSPLAEKNERSTVNNKSNVECSNIDSWIQCDIPLCGKWRKLHDDTGDVTALSSEKWYCSLNPDPQRNACTISEEEWSEEEDESVYSTFKPGVIVLGKIPGYPWWPGLVENDPDYRSHFWLDKRGKRVHVSYHMTFFGKPVSRAWLRDVAVKRFKGDEKFGELGQAAPENRNYSSKLLSVALAEARKALDFPFYKRLQKFGFLARFKGKRKRPGKGVSTDEKEEESGEDNKDDDGEERSENNPSQNKNDELDDDEEDESDDGSGTSCSNDSDWYSQTPPEGFPGKLTARQLKERQLMKRLKVRCDFRKNKSDKRTKKDKENKMVNNKQKRKRLGSRYIID